MTDFFHLPSWKHSTVHASNIIRLHKHEPKWLGHFLFISFGGVITNPGGSFVHHFESFFSPIMFTPICTPTNSMHRLPLFHLLTNWYLSSFVWNLVIVCLHPLWILLCCGKKSTSYLNDSRLLCRPVHPPSPHWIRVIWVISYVKYLNQGITESICKFWG